MAFDSAARIRAYLLLEDNTKWYEREELLKALVQDAYDAGLSEREAMQWTGLGFARLPPRDLSPGQVYEEG